MCREKHSLYLFLHLMNIVYLNTNYLLYCGYFFLDLYLRNNYGVLSIVLRVHANKMMIFEMEGLSMVITEKHIQILWQLRYCMLGFIFAKLGKILGINLYILF